jgi:hypothetical protein
MQLAYVTNYPSDLAGKLLNHVNKKKLLFKQFKIKLITNYYLKAHNLRELKRVGINLEKVPYICCGVRNMQELEHAKGVVKKGFYNIFGWVQ